jgi:coenzyme F420 hydrogenase subunit beta
LEEISIARATQSQDAGLRHRKAGITYRLFLERNVNAWTPTKRALPAKGLKPSYERKRQRLRIKLRDLSHTAFLAAIEKKDLNLYLGRMRPVYRKYLNTRSSWLRRALSISKRIAKRLPRFNN